MPENDNTSLNKSKILVTTVTAIAFISIFMFISLNVRLDTDRKDNNSDRTEDFYLKGLTYEREGDYKSAEELYRDEIKIHPENAAAYNSLAWLYIDKLDTNYIEAIILAKIAIELINEKDYPAKNYQLANYMDTLGWAYYKNGEYNEAVKYLERAVALVEADSFVSHLESARNKQAEIEKSPQ